MSAADIPCPRTAVRREEYGGTEYGGLPVKYFILRCTPTVFIRLQIENEAQRLINGLHLFWANHSLAR